jgi:CHAD domain-containing protein
MATALYIPLETQMELGEAARRALLVRTAEAALRVEGARRRADIEGVHDLRVAVRRLRAVLDGFRAALGGKTAARALDARLRRLMRAASPVRDMDVTFALLGALRRKAPAAARGSIVEIARRFEEGRAAAEARMDRAIDTFVLRDLPVIGAAVAGARGRAPAQGPVGARLRRRAARMELLAGRAGSLSPEDLHALRVSVKKARDLVEAAGALLPAARARLPALRRLATELGDLHDLDVWIARMAPLRRDGAVRAGAEWMWSRARAERDERAARIARRLQARGIQALAAALRG